jgi:NADH:ubiquinone oxidoreductase subunit 4 (subunit M)
MVACVWLGVYPKPLLDRLKPDVDAVARIYQPPQAAVRSQSP